MMMETASVKKWEAKSYAITIRPRLGLQDKLQQRLINYLKKQNYGRLCIEKAGVERHAHLQIWSDEMILRESLRKAMKRILIDTVDFESDEDKKKQMAHAIDVKIAYNDWLENYCIDNPDKSDKPEIIYESVPVDDTDYYASQEEQALIQAKANAKDQHMFNLEQQFHEYYGEVSKENVAYFLSDAMFNSRTMMTMRKQMDRVNLCETLYNYINKSIDKNLFLKKEEQKSFEEKIYSTLGMTESEFIQKCENKKYSNNI